MLLAIDVGNTNIVLGVFEGERLVESWRLGTLRERTADDGEQQQWSELGYAEQPDRERRAGLVEHLVRKRGNRDRAAEK